jgi:hypothetical protein
MTPLMMAPQCIQVEELQKQRQALERREYLLQCKEGLAAFMEDVEMREDAVSQRETAVIQDEMWIAEQQRRLQQEREKLDARSRELEVAENARIEAARSFNDLHDELMAPFRRVSQELHRSLVQIDPQFPPVQEDTQEPADLQAQAPVDEDPKEFDIESSPDAPGQGHSSE